MRVELKMKKCEFCNHSKSSIALLSLIAKSTIDPTLALAKSPMFDQDKILDDLELYEKEGGYS